MSKINFLKKVSVTLLFMSFLLSATAYAHRGVKGAIDTCRFSVGSEVIHFSAYTPATTGGEGFCHVIPDIGLTHLVFDYEGAALRHTTVEFEVTKEPDGERIYYHKPEKIKKGSVDAKIDFNQFGAGEYLVHVTILYEGEKLDSHLPFAVGVGLDEGGLSYRLIIPIVLIIISLIVVSIMTKRKDDPSIYRDEEK